MYADVIVAKLIVARASGAECMGKGLIVKLIIPRCRWGKDVIRFFLKVN